jgi:DUF1365 family protein
MSASALYVGTVVHRRLTPKAHALRYRMMMALIDLDEVDALAARLWFFSRNRFNLFSFHDRDHLGPAATGGEKPGALREKIEADLAAAGIPGGGAIRLLSLPRILGYAFNPLSVYFCHAADGSLAAIVYAVRNTFGQRHGYLIPVDRAAAAGTIAQSCQKVFHVSPFMDMDMTYAFRVVAPGETVSIAIDGLKDGARIIATAFAGARRPLSDRALLGTFAAHPFLALAVVAGIHWEALKLWLKGVGLRARPAPPEHSLSIVHQPSIVRSRES